MTSRKTISALISALKLRDRISAEEENALASLRWTVRHFAAGEEIIAEGSRPSQTCLVINGFAARCLWLNDGTRGLAAIHIAGDFVDLHGLYLRTIDHSVVALTNTTVAFVPHSGLSEVMANHPHLSRMLSLLLAIDAAIERQWIIGLSRRQAEGRLAHFFCETYERLKIVGCTNGHRFAFPISQATLADMIGISMVHANRTIQNLRSMELIEWENGVLSILKPSGIIHLAEFDPVYLCLTSEPR